MTTPAKPSALDTLKSLSSKKPQTAAVGALGVEINDPAIVGAKKSKSSASTVTLGFDPSIAEKAAYCASLKEALEKAEADFAVAQSEMRDYGKSKRALYNKTFKTTVTTVKVPYSVDVPGGHETKEVGVVCANKYSVQQEIILNNKDSLGEAYGKLFLETTSSTLKANAEELFRGILTDVAGFTPEQVDNAMEALVEKTTKVAATEVYEQEHEKLPDTVKTLLDQAVTRNQPSLRFS